MPLAAVTGATGFVGPHLIAAMARHGWKLRLLIRRWTPLPSLPGVDAEIVWGDLSDEASLRRLVDGSRRRGPCRRRDQGAPGGGFPGDQSRRHGPTFFDGAEYSLPAPVVAGGPRAAAFALCRQQARGGGGRRPADRTLAAVRAPAVYGPGDRETLAYFKMAARGFALQPNRPDARLSLIHVEDLAEALALALDRSFPSAVCEIDDGRPGGYSHRGHGGRGGGGARPARSTRWRIPQRTYRDGREPSIASPVSQILTPAKVRELFHPDWVAHDRSLAAATGFAARYDLPEGFRHTIWWYRACGWL